MLRGHGSDNSHLRGRMSYQGGGKPSPYPRRCTITKGRGKPSPYPRRSTTKDQGGGKPSPYPIRSPFTTRLGYGLGLPPPWKSLPQRTICNGVQAGRKKRETIYMTATRISYATCPLCEATCGLEIETRGREILSIRGDAQDVFSSGYICPKAYSLKELHADPDCIHEPMVRRGDQWMSVSWDDAFAEIERGLTPLLQEYGRNALAIYVGNPNAHNLASLVYLPALLSSARTHNVYSASTVDQMPKHVSAGLMFGTMLSIPVPDLERTACLLLLGANPLVSNGSLMTAPDMRGRLRRLRQRGGRIVVIDPYRTRTAQEADEHHFIRPGYDAHFLFALVHTLFAEGLVSPGALAGHIAGLEQVRTLAEPFAPERVAAACGIEAAAIRAIARELAAAPRAAVYGRIGTCTQAFGTLVSWLVDVLNALTGNLDREGGAMFPQAAAGARNATGTPGRGRGVRFGRWKSRVRGLPECYGELPASCLAEEIDTPGEGQV